MPASGATARSSAKRDALLDTAEGLFARHGYRAVGIDTVLAAAGVAKMTLYKHFRSKEELIAAVLERRGNTIAGGLAERIAAAPDDPGARLLAVFEWLEQAVRSPQFHGCLFIKAASEYPAAEDLPRQAAEAFKGECRELLEGLSRDLAVADPEGLARQLQLLFEGALVVAFLQRTPLAAADARRAAEALLASAPPAGQAGGGQR
ncbi:TetR/AcrR family transcriptional regulator [Cyanobium gracile UHCC 0139]|uniref:TetR/AcrR family transcriptional regulator n=1 Tax=Cyanobium gracile UHCC 0139 TaxID=3110308 RepID=A0ABU5RTB4_9CYAN|nr:TetR/AcrR family transcriptional regulator [Cyanobium gracile]MEA5391027.1 TetR/AcrR family transcriptional regulator [Cyanobium gracile UHCC 0139]